MPLYKILVRKFVVKETWMEIDARNIQIAKGTALLKADGASIERATNNSSDAFITGDPVAGPEIVKIEKVKD